MICDGSTCPAGYEGEQIYEPSFYDTDENEFIKNLKRKKCKIVKLIRHQMHDVQSSQYLLPTTVHRDWTLPKDTVKQTISKGVHAHNSMSTGQIWPLRFLGKIRHRICMIVLVAGMALLMALIYSLYFHAYLCTNGKSCVTILRYTHAKHTLF